MKSIYLVGIIAVLTIVTITIGGFASIQAMAQMTTGKTTNSGNMTSGGNTTMTGQSGNISGIDQPGF